MPVRYRIKDKILGQRWSLDAGRLQQVITNLVDNALQVSEVVEVRVAQEAASLVVEFAREMETLRLRDSC